MDSHLAEAEREEELPARRVLDEDARDEFLEAGLLGRLHEGLHRKRACPTAPGLAGSVYGELGHAGVALAGAVGRHIGEGDHRSFFLHHHDGVSTVEPVPNLPGRARMGLERRDALLDALVVDAGYGVRVSQVGCSGLHDRILTPSLAPTLLPYSAVHEAQISCTTSHQHLSISANKELNGSL